jgi:hypothetical protein
MTSVTQVRCTLGDVDATTVVAVAGIAGTLAASIISPLVAGKNQRRTLREEHRITAYADLLKAARQLHSNAETWKSDPYTDLEEPSTDDIRSMEAWVRLLGSDPVVSATSKVAEIRSQIDEARRAEPEREALASLAAEMTDAVQRLEFAVRSETKN